MNKTTIGIIVAIVIILGGAYLIMGTSSGPNNVSNTSQQNQNALQGRAVFSVTDAALDMSTISEINMKVNSVDAHSSTSGWVNVSSVPRTYSLLALNAQNKSELLADLKLNTGTYDQVRLMVDSISVKTKAGATKPAKLPSGELKINTKLVVNANTTSSINFDFLADKSLRVTGNGSYIFAPVVKTETKSNVGIDVSGTNAVSITGGNVDDENTVGMDIDGSVKLNFELDAKQKLNIDSNNNIEIDVNGLLK